VHPTLIHRITPRFKSLLHECHLCGNLAHKHLTLYFIFIAVDVLLMVGGIFNASMMGAGGGEDGSEEEVAEEGAGGDVGTCVPWWVFANGVQPIVNILVFVHMYGLLNLAIERDVDQDIVEMK
jgi:hypothetical protein